MENNYLGQTGNYMSEKKNLKTNVIEFPSPTKLDLKEKRKINSGSYASGETSAEES